MARRNKVLTMILFPFAASLLIVGWILYFIGSNRINKPNGFTKKNFRNELQFDVFFPEEQMVGHKSRQ
jgi:hypothetical protein